MKKVWLYVVSEKFTFTDTSAQGRTKDMILWAIRYNPVFYFFYEGSEGRQTNCLVIAI